MISEGEHVGLLAATCAAQLSFGDSRNGWPHRKCNDKREE